LQHRPESDAVTHALKLVGDFFPDLEKQNLKLLTKKSGFSTDQIEAAFDLIRTLNPRPGGGIGNSQADYVVPDVYVVQHNEKWVVSLNPDISPRLRVHPFYSTLLKRGDKSKDNRYMRDQLQEARWFIKSIQSRNDTILRVAEVIVEKQQGYFEQGEEAMKPMVLRDVAETLGMHESTISRVTTQKYMLTPKGIVEFKYFFSSHLDTADGGNASATAIRAMIRSLISDENPQKPLSDSKITTILLQEKGIKVARRTVAKYREAMQISPSNERKRIA
jgi:RNA polymerase sigma-54 factor